MSNTLYFARGKKTEFALSQLVQNYSLEKSFESRKETIFRGEQMLVALAKEYIYLYIYDANDTSLRNIIRKKLYD